MNVNICLTKILEYVTYMHTVMSVYTILLNISTIYLFVTLSFTAKAQSSRRRLPSPTHPPPLHRPEGRAWLRCHHLGEVMNSRAHCRRMLPSAENTCPNHNDTFDMTCMGMGNLMFCLVEHPTVWRTSLTSYSALQIPGPCVYSIEKDFNSTK